MSEIARTVVSQSLFPLKEAMLIGRLWEGVAVGLRKAVSAVSTQLRLVRREVRFGVSSRAVNFLYVDELELVPKL